LLSFLKTLLKVAGWLLVVSAVGAGGLVALGGHPETVSRPWSFLILWITLLQPAVLTAAVVSIFPKARRTPVFTTVWSAAVVVFAFCVLFYVAMTLARRENAFLDRSLVVSGGATVDNDLTNTGVRIAAVGPALRFFVTPADVRS
jgi:hypothetical protein